MYCDTPVEFDAIPNPDDFEFQLDYLQDSLGRSDWYLIDRDGRIIFRKQKDQTLTHFIEFAKRKIRRTNKDCLLDITLCVSDAAKLISDLEQNGLDL